MSNNIKFWLIATLLMVSFSVGGYWIGFYGTVKSLVEHANINELDIISSEGGLQMFGIGIVGLAIGLFAACFGFFLALIFIRRLGKRWGGQLNFGSHPVLKLTTLAFLTFLVTTFILMLFFAKLPIK